MKNYVIDDTEMNRQLTLLQLIDVNSNNKASIKFLELLIKQTFDYIGELEIYSDKVTEERNKLEHDIKYLKKHPWQIFRYKV
jgi:hypothetical protein